MKTPHIVAVLVITAVVASIVYFYFKNVAWNTGEVEVLGKEAYISCGDLYIKTVFRSRSGIPLSIEEVVIGGAIVTVNSGVGFNGTTYVRIERENSVTGEEVVLNAIVYNASFKQGESVPVQIKVGDTLQYQVSLAITRAFCYENVDIEVREVYYTGVFNIVLRIRNIGSDPTTLDQVFINGKTLATAGANSNLPFPLTLGPGEEKIVTIWLTTGYMHGQVIELRLHTMGGNEYSKLITLP